MYNAAIIGCGRIAGLNDDSADISSVRTHAKAYGNNSKTTLICAADVDPERLKKFGGKWSISKLYRDYKDMLMVEKPDIVSICTPNNTHYEVLKYIAQNTRNIKAVFCEKPMTMSVEQAEEIVRLYQEKETILAVNHTRQWEPGHVSIRELIKQGKLGRIQKVTCYYYKGIVHNGIHLMDYLLDVLGKVEKAHILGAMEEPEGDLTLDAQLIFEGNIPCILIGFDKQYYDIFEMDFVGTEGRIRIENFGLSFRYWKRELNPLYGGDIELIEKPLGFESEYRNAMSYAVQNIVDAVEGRGKLKCDGLKALEVLKTVVWLKSLASSTFKSNHNMEGQT